jgi:methylated-DNA-[protein]-cysteine S-methyltransferase
MDMNDALEQRLGRAAAALDPPALDAERFAEAARASGIEDVAYALEDSPIGRLLLAVTPRGLVRISYVDHFPEEDTLRDLAARVSPRVLEDRAALDEPRRQLDEYFGGRRRDFELPLDWTLVGEFGRAVLGRTARIPYGEVETYGDVAREIGHPGAARATGNALGASPMPIVVPCHRVVRAGGVIGHYTGGRERKLQLLALEAPQGRLGE